MERRWGCSPVTRLLPDGLTTFTTLRPRRAVSLEHLLVLGHARVTGRSGRATSHGTPQLRPCRVILAACLGFLHGACCNHVMPLTTAFPCKVARSWVLKHGSCVKDITSYQAGVHARTQDQVLAPKSSFLQPVNIPLVSSQSREKPNTLEPTLTPGFPVCLVCPNVVCRPIQISPCMRWSIGRHCMLSF